MSWADRITNTLFGRRLGLQQATTNVTGSGRTGQVLDLIVGAEAVRMGVSTAETTGSNIQAFGVSFLTTVSSSAVFTLDPPIPGVEKTLQFNSSATSASPIYVKTANNETFSSSVMTSGTVLSSSANAVGPVRLIGLTTAVWGILNTVTTSSFKLSTTT